MANPPREQALYVVTRNDLSPSARAVQSGHAVAQFLLEHKTDWNNGTLVYLKAHNEDHLRELIGNVKDRNHSIFVEPDLGMSLTAVAVLGPANPGESLFPDLRLL